MTPYLMTNFSLNPQTPSVFNVFHGMRSEVIVRAGGEEKAAKMRTHIMHTFARISDNALCFSDKRKAASVCRAGCSGERKHANTKTLVALVFSLSITAKEFNILRGRAHIAKL